MEKIEDLPNDYKFLTLTFCSTYVIELLRSMPFLIINPKNSQNLSYCLPKDNFFYAYNYIELKEKINQFVNNPDFYNHYWKELLSIIKDSYII